MSIFQKIKRRYLVFKVKSWYRDYYQLLDRFDCDYILAESMSPRLANLRIGADAAFDQVKEYDLKIGYNPKEEN